MTTAWDGRRSVQDHSTPREKRSTRVRCEWGPLLSDAPWTFRHKSWVLRDVVFQDVGFENNSFKPLTHISFRCEVPTPSVVEGR